MKKFPISIALGIVLVIAALFAWTGLVSAHGEILVVDGSEYGHESENNGSIHWTTPTANPQTANYGYVSWKGNGKEHLSECEYGVASVHWVYTKQSKKLVLSHVNCKNPPVTTSTSTTTSTTSSTTVPPSSSTTQVPDTSTTTLPDTTSSTQPTVTSTTELTTTTSSPTTSMPDTVPGSPTTVPSPDTTVPEETTSTTAVVTNIIDPPIPPTAAPIVPATLPNTGMDSETAKNVTVLGIILVIFGCFALWVAKNNRKINN